MTTRSQKRRTRPARQWDTSVSSPCVSVCSYGGDGICEGCMRNADEIREWMIMTREQKLQVLATIEQRKDELFGT